MAVHHLLSMYSYCRFRAGTKKWKITEIFGYTQFCGHSVRCGPALLSPLGNVVHHSPVSFPKNYKLARIHQKLTPLQ